MQIISLEEAAGRLKISVQSLQDKRYRARIGLRAVKIGRKVVFDEADIQQVIDRGKEPAQPKEQRT